MFNTATKRIGWFCLFCLCLLCCWLFLKIIPPSLAAPHPIKPIFRVDTGSFGANRIAFSPNGKQLFCLFTETTGGNSIQRWDIQKAQKLPPITSVENFTLLSRDGKYYATSNSNHEYHVFNTNNQKQFATLPTDGALKDITGKEPLAISVNRKYYPKDKRKLYISTWRYYIRNIHSRKLIDTTPPLNTRSIHDTFPDQSIAISPDGSKVLSLMPVSTEKETRNFRISDSNPNPIPISVKKINRLTGKTDIFPSKIKFVDPFAMYKFAQISNDNNLYAAVSTSNFTGWGDNGEDGSIWCYDLPHQKLRWKYFQQDHFPILLKFSPDGTMLAAGGHNDDVRGVTGFVSIIDAKTGKLIHEYTEQTLRDQLNDRAKLAYFNVQKSTFSKINFYLEKFHLNTLYSGHDTFVNQLAPHDSGVPAAISWSSDSKTLAISYIFGDVKLWRVKE